MANQAGGRRVWAIATLVAGLFAMGVTYAFTRLPEVLSAGPCMTSESVVRFEFARTLGDLDAVFGAPGEACRAKVIVAMDAVNTLDARAYIPGYAAFVVLAALFLGHGRLPPPVLAAAAAGLGALAADYVETASLLAYTPDLHPAPEALALSSAAAWTKFWLLGLNALALAWICLTSQRRRPILAVLQLAPILGVAVAALAPGQLSAITLGFTVGWVSVLAMAARAALLGR